MRSVIIISILVIVFFSQCTHAQVKSGLKNHHRKQHTSHKDIRNRKFTKFIQFSKLTKPTTSKSTKKLTPNAHSLQTTQRYTTIHGTRELSTKLDELIGGEQEKTDIAVYVKSMRYADTLYTRNISQPLTPASTIKIFTAEAALLFLGAEYRFSTQLLTDAKSYKDGVLQGNLYVVLSGDPTLTYNGLLELAATLKSLNIEAIAGNVYIDNSAYDQSFYGPGWEWKDKNYCYAAPISASIINHNCLPFRIESARATGQTATIIKSKDYFYPAIKNTVVTKAKRLNTCGVRLSSANAIISIDGCMRKGHETGVSYVVTDIPEYNRALFKSLLSGLAIRVYGTVTFGSAPDNLLLIGQHASKPLHSIITDMLKKSDNVIAGALFKKIGQLYTNHPGSWENGSKAVSNILSHYAGINITGMRVLDGSGLSPDNLVTPLQMMQLLDFAYHHSPTSNAFITALPIAGVDGTLKHRMGNIMRKVRAKTGTISGVRTLAGFVVTQDQEPLAFVIMINGNKDMGPQYRDIEDRIATFLTLYRRN